MITYQSPSITDLEKKYVNEAIDSGWVGSKGDFIDRFEEAFAKYIGVDYAITCSSGTAALQLAYISCGMMAEVPVYVPKNTFRATINMAALLSSKVQVINSEEDTWNIDLSRFRDMEGFVVGVHLYGNPCDMGQVYRFKKITFIEDCAQSLGSEYRGKKCGSFGRASVFSFHSAKTITTGEGGMVCTNDKNVANHVRSLKNHQMSVPYVHKGIGFNYRMTNLQAALGLAQLERIEDLIQGKKATYDFYNKNLSYKYIRQKLTKHSKYVPWASSFSHPNADSIREKLKSDGIETRPGFLSPNEIISFPSSPFLTKDELSFIVEKANSYA